MARICHKSQTLTVIYLETSLPSEVQVPSSNLGQSLFNSVDIDFSSTKVGESRMLENCSPILTSRFKLNETLFQVRLVVCSCFEVASKTFPVKNFALTGEGRTFSRLVCYSALNLCVTIRQPLNHLIYTPKQSYKAGTYVLVSGFDHDYVRILSPAFLPGILK